MQRALLAIVLLSIMLGACTQRMICPAYQSAFIYDQEQLRKKFSYFQEDSTPKVITASRNKYLIAETQPYKKRIRNLQTVPMKPVFVSLPDSLKPEDQREGIDGEDDVVAGAELDLAARSVIDSTYIVDVPQPEEKPKEEDSVYMITKDKELRLLKYNMPDSLILDASTGKWVPQKPKYAVVNVTFNVDQDNYMWYLRDYLVLPDVRLARNQQNNQGDEDGDEGTSKSGKKTKKKKGIKGFFKNLFGKKEEQKEEEKTTDELEPRPVDEEETFDYVEEEEQAKPPVSDPPTEEEKPKEKKEKKKKEKKPKKKKADQPEAVPPADEETTPPAEKPKEEDSF